MVESNAPDAVLREEQVLIEMFKELIFKENKIPYLNNRVER